MSKLPQEKSLRWLANQFTFVADPKDDVERLSNAIHVYCTAGADCIDSLHSEVSFLRKVRKVRSDE